MSLESDSRNLKRPTKPEMQDRLWRTDPYDGLRPFIKIRKMVKKKILIIIQTRIGSSRLPGKVLRKLINKPILLHIVNRLEKLKTVILLLRQVKIKKIKK